MRDGDPATAVFLRHDRLLVALQAQSVEGVDLAEDVGQTLLVHGVPGFFLFQVAHEHELTLPPSDDERPVEGAALKSHARPLAVQGDVEASGVGEHHIGPFAKDRIEACGLGSHLKRTEREGHNQPRPHCLSARFRCCVPDAHRSRS